MQNSVEEEYKGGQAEHNLNNVSTNRYLVKVAFAVD